MEPLVSRVRGTHCRRGLLQLGLVPAQTPCHRHPAQPEVRADLKKYADLYKAVGLRLD